ncbi:MAG: DUF5050 domain-containing protein [Oscillospiraceae bacterium]|nr:DUF5050 domain-containing protein [Oscillospiraceae bacterium]
MRSRSILPALLALALLLLCACGQTEPPAADASPTVTELTPEPADSVAPEPPAAPEPTSPAALSLEGSQAMARFLNAGRALLTEDALFCFDFDEDWLPALARYTWKDGTLSAYTILAKGCVPEYLCRAEGWLFYIDRASGALERVPEGGGEREILLEGPCGYLSLREGRLYLCDESGRFLSLGPDGKEEELLLEGPCAFAYPLDGAIVYQDLSDGGRLHLLDRETGEDRALTDKAAWAPLILAGELWYQDGEGLYCSDLAGGEPRAVSLPEKDGDLELLPEAGGLLLRGIRDGDGPQQWSGAPGGPYHPMARGYRICDWLGGGVCVDTVYEPDGRIRCFLLTETDGAEISFLAGKTL